MSNSYGLTYRGDGSNRGPSVALWKGCPFRDIEDWFVGKMIVNDDFHNLPDLSADANDDLYGSYIDTGDTIKMSATQPNGVVEFITDTSDNDECWLQAGGNAGATAVISNTAGAAFPLWYETRVNVSAITDSLHNFFAGLMQEGRANADTITDAGAIGDFDCIGFRALEADGDEVNFVYQKETQTLQQKIDALHTLVADTFVKLGFFYNPFAKNNEQIAVFVNGVKQSTFVTKTNIDAATFPEGEEMAPIMGAKNGTTTGITFRCDWWKCYQLSEVYDYSFAA